MDTLLQALRQIEEYPDDSTARQDCLSAMVAYMIKRGFSLESIQITWAYAHADGIIERCEQCRKVKRITGNHRGPLTNGLTYASHWCICPTRA